MENSTEKFSQLMTSVRAGSEDAIDQLINHCEHHILRAVRTRLNRMIRSKFDSQDFVQAVWLSFFQNLSTIKQFDKSEDIIRFLVRIAGNKVIDETRRRMISQKRNVNREKSLDELEVTNLSPVISSDPSPSDMAIADEQWKLMIKKQPERDKSILQLRISGKSTKQIAEELNVHERTIRRALSRIAADFASVN